MTPTFNPPISPTAGATDKPEIKILQAEFGDGSTQPTPPGLNHIRKVLTLRFDLLEPDEKDAIVTFLEERKGVEPFLYTLPGYSTPTLYTCSNWDTTALAAGMFAVSATLRQSFQAAAA